KLIVSVPGLVFAQLIASRSEPGPASVVFSTTRLQTVVPWEMLVLLFGFGSVSFAVAEAVLVIEPGALGAVVTIVTVTLELLVRVPRSQVTVPLAFGHEPKLEEADTNCTPLGSTSVSLTPVAVFGPLFVTVTVYVRVCPVTTGSGESVLTTF